MLSSRSSCLLLRLSLFLLAAAVTSLHASCSVDSDMAFEKILTDITYDECDVIELKRTVSIGETLPYSHLLRGRLFKSTNAKLIFDAAGTADLRELQLTGPLASMVFDFYTGDLVVLFGDGMRPLSMLRTLKVQSGNVTVEHMPPFRVIKDLHANGDSHIDMDLSHVEVVSTLRVFGTTTVRRSGSFLHLPNLRVVSTVVADNWHLIPGKPILPSSSMITERFTLRVDSTGSDAADLAQQLPLAPVMRTISIELIDSQGDSVDLVADVANHIMQNVVFTNSLTVSVPPSYANEVASATLEFPALRWVDSMILDLSTSTTSGAWKISAPRLEAVNDLSLRVNRIAVLNFCSLSSINQVSTTSTCSNSVAGKFNGAFALCTQQQGITEVAQCQASETPYSDAFPGGSLLRDFMSPPTVHFEPSIKVDAGFIVRNLSDSSIINFEA
ncbi:MAG: hypothetical protein MHM6MM_006772, partial [Cercozoa sp. M6MM]